MIHGHVDTRPRAIASNAEGAFLRRRPWSPLPYDRAIDVPPLAGKVRLRRTTEGASKHAVALGVAAEVGFERGAAQREALVDERDELHELEPRAVSDERDAELVVKAAAEEARRGREIS